MLPTVRPELLERANPGRNAGEARRTVETIVVTDAGHSAAIDISGRPGLLQRTVSVVRRSSHAARVVVGYSAYCTVYLENVGVSGTR